MVLRLIKNAFRQIGRQPFRTLLVLQGVIWGTALGVLPPALIHGSMQRAEDDAESSGIDRITIALERREVSESFTGEDIEMLQTKYGDRIRAFNTYAMRRNRSGHLILVEEGGLEGRGMKIVSGRGFTDEELKSGARVCVLDDEKLENLVAEVGSKVRLFDEEFEVIGIAAPKSDEKVDEFGYNSGHFMGRFINALKQNMGAIEGNHVKRLRRRDNIMIPHAFRPQVKVNVIEMRADPKLILDLRDEIRSDLVAVGHQPIIYTNALLPFLFRSTLDTFVELNRAVFFLCIVVGTSVVCVLMVLSVVERQREIAIRRVEGARKWHVALQFIVETGTICSVGAMLGVPLGCGLAAFRVWLEPLEAVTWAFPPVESSVMVCIVTVIGLIGGLLPAWRAMRLDPVEVLRNE